MITILCLLQVAMRVMHTCEHAQAQVLCSGILSSGFRVQGRAEASGCRARTLGFRFQGSAFRDFGVRVQGMGSELGAQASDLRI